VFPVQVTSGICRDPLMERLVRALLPAEEAGVVLLGFYTDAFHSTLLKRLADLRNNTSSSAGDCDGCHQADNPRRKANVI
jgi:hypothetical protein